MDINMEEIIFSLITHSGSARSYIFEAFKEVEGCNMEKAHELMELAKSELLKAHSIQTKLIQNEAAGENIQVNLLMVHAQDHLMTSILAKDLIERMVVMQQKINRLERMEEK